MTPPPGPHPALFAAGFDWLEAILPFLFVGFWILSQVFAVFRRVAGGPVRPPVGGRPVRPRDAAGAPPPLPEAERSALERQIADFLRDVQRDPRVADRPQPKAAPPRRPAASASPSAARVAPAAARQVPAGAATPRTVGGLGTGPTDVARHVQDAFAQELGHLHSGLEASGADGPGREPTSRGASGLAPADLVRNLRDPALLRQAVLLREILERPIERW